MDSMLALALVAMKSENTMWDSFVEILSWEGKEVGLCVKSGFLTMALLTFWKKSFCIEGKGAVLCTVGSLSSIFGLHPLNASRTPVMTTKVF